MAACSGALDREAFTFTNYDLQVHLEPAQRRLSARGIVTLRNDSKASQKTLALQISSALSWRSLKAHGQPLDFVSQSYTSDLDHTGALSETVVTLPTEVAPGASLELEIGYEGVIPLDVTRLTRIGVPEDVARRSDWDRIDPSIVALRGAGHVAWYPIAAAAASLSDGNAVFRALDTWNRREADSRMRFNLCVESDSDASWTVLMNDTPDASPAASPVRSSARADAGSCSEHEFDPLRLTVPMIVAGIYSQLQKDTARIYFREADSEAAGDLSVAVQLAASFVSEWLGPPRNKVRIAELPDKSDASFESGSLFATPLAPGTDAQQQQLAVIPPLVHARFFSPRPWLNEGLAHFIQAAYRERQDGRQAALDFMALRLPGMLEAEKNDASGASGRSSLVDAASEELYRTKAMYVWWMLRDWIGENELRKALAAYRAADDHDPKYLQRLAESQSHRDLGWFFEDWVYRDRGLPDFHVDSVYSHANTKGGYLVTVTIGNTGAAGAEVPVDIRFADGTVSRRVEVRGSANAVFRIDVPSPPIEVKVNDGSVPESNFDNNVFEVETPAP